MALYFAPDGTTDPALFTQLGEATHLVAASGLYQGGIRTAPINPPGFFGMFQVRAWETAYGATYEEALVAPPQNGRPGLIGLSSIIRVDTGDPTTSPPGTLGSLRGISVIVLTVPSGCIPEPSPLALGVVGAAMLFLFRGGKRNE